uniref:Uncharacterized protein n=1 Tax=Arundo donax TaxID=35708 RepID=A0A0A8Z2U4_ARUDO
MVFLSGTLKHLHKQARDYLSADILQ